MYPIRAERGGSSVSCTASFLRFGEVCRLVSDAHCLSGSLRVASAADQVRIGLGAPQEGVPAIFGAADFSSSVIVRVLRRNTLYDVMELEVPPEIANKCRTLYPVRDTEDPLADVSMKAGGRVMNSLAGFGFVKEQPHQETSDNIDHHSGYGYSNLRLEWLSQDPFATLIEADRFRMVVGMSGGLVQANEDFIMGLYARFVPFQQRTFLIGMATLNHWLKSAGPEEHDSNLASSEGAAELKQALPGYYLRSEQRFGGDNGHVGGGDNGHVGGGDNGHVGGGDGAVDSRFQSASPLALFREPDEGVVVRDAGPDFGKVIVGVGSEQIDGWNDLQLKPLQSKGPRIYREGDGYLNATLRAKLIDRLEGYYNAYMPGDGPDEQHFIYGENRKNVEGYDLLNRGGGMTDIDINTGRKVSFSEIVGGKERVRTVKGPLISIHLYSHPLASNGNPLASLQLQAFHLRFQVEISEDAKTIRLIPVLPVGSSAAPRTLSCDNRDFLKLVCANSSVEIGLSLQDTRERLLSYRLAYSVGTEGKAVSYQFGKLQGVRGKHAKSEFRKVPK